MTAGQWFKGRIYERRCDLSPAGDLLIYFAAKYKTPLRSWTAISRPPFLTALAVWPKGDAWGGGGLFESRRAIRLNHRPTEMRLADDFRLARSMRIEPLGEGSGWGEDDPIHHARLLRDGWRWIEERSAEREHGAEDPTWITYDPPIRYVRSLGRDSSISLEMAIEGIHERQGPWYVTRYRLVADAQELRDLGRADWAEVAPDGDLLLARDGRLFRLTADRRGDWRDAHLREVADLRGHRFEERIAPPSARRW